MKKIHAVRVYFKDIFGKDQQFTGICVKQTEKSITVRKMASNSGVEYTFKLISPFIEMIELLQFKHTKHSKLYFIRKHTFKVRDGLEPS